MLVVYTTHVEGHREGHTIVSDDGSNHGVVKSKAAAGYL